VKPTTPFERSVAKLNTEAFMSQEYATIDDALIYCLFTKKGRDSYYNTLHAICIGDSAIPSSEEGGATA